MADIPALTIALSPEEIMTLNGSLRCRSCGHHSVFHDVYGHCWVVTGLGEQEEVGTCVCLLEDYGNG